MSKTIRHTIGLLIFILSSVFLCDGFVQNVQASELAKELSFELSDLDGETVTFEEIMRGKKAVLINFWATWCPSCRREIPELMSLRQKFLDKGFDVVGIDVGEPKLRVEAYQQKHQISYPVLLDPLSQTAKKYGIVGLPGSVLIDQDGKILGRYQEYDSKLEKDVEKIFL